MREILFRGKLADEGYWVEGGYIHLHKTTYCVAGEDDGSNDIHRIVFERMTDWNLPNRHLMGDVIPETVGQYTGLTDKNGKKIFEGDVVKYTSELNHTYTCTVLYHEKNAIFNLYFLETKGCIGNFVICSGNKCEVIGNIHDNPELLEGGEENAE